MEKALLFKGALSESEEQRGLIPLNKHIYMNIEQMKKILLNQRYRIPDQEEVGVCVLYTCMNMMGHWYPHSCE